MSGKNHLARLRYTRLSMRKVTWRAFIFFELRISSEKIYRIEATAKRTCQFG